jgi:hypothetical protein
MSHLHEMAGSADRFGVLGAIGRKCAVSPKPLIIHGSPE